MPAIHLFHRRTILGGDDLHPAAFLSICLHASQLVLLVAPILGHVAHESSKLPGGFFQYIWYGIYTAGSSNTNNSSDGYDDNASDDASCPQQQQRSFCLLISLYAIAAAAYGIAAIALERRIAQSSSIGTPVEREPRSKRVQHLLELKLVPFTTVLFLICVTGIGAAAFAPSYQRCLLHAPSQDDDDQLNQQQQRWWLHLLWLALALLLLSQLGEVLVSALYLLHLLGQPPEPVVSASDSLLLMRRRQEEEVAMTSSMQPQGSPRSMGSAATASSQQTHNHELVEEMWADRCASACRCLGVATCFMFGGQDLHMTTASGPGGATTPFGDVARALADYLETRGVLDVVPSDIVVGFMVLQRLQHQRRRQARSGILLMAASSDDGNDIGDASAMAAAAAPDAAAVAAVEDLLGGNSTAKTPASGSQGILAGQSRVQRHPPSLSSAGHFTGLGDRSSSGFVPNDPTNGSQLLRRHDPNDMALLEEGARYAKYALAIYTWVLYLYVHPVTGVPRLLLNRGAEMVCSGSSTGGGSGGYTTLSSEAGDQSGTNGSANSRTASAAQSPSMHSRQGGGDVGGLSWQIHKSALLLTTGLSESDLLYVQLQSSFTQNPYCILLDHAWKSVVVSIRGSFSLEDCVT